MANFIYIYIVTSPFKIIGQYHVQYFKVTTFIVTRVHSVQPVRTDVRSKPQQDCQQMK